MAVSSSQVSVGTSATLVASGEIRDSIYPPGHPTEENRTVSVRIKRPAGTTDVYIGGPGVTTASGYLWGGSEAPLDLILEPGEVLYAVVATGTQAVHVLRVG
jgi:hypothetical protein